MLDGSGDKSLDRNVSALHKTSDNKWNNLQDSTSNGSLVRDVIVTLDRESDSIKKDLVGNVMDSEVDGLGGRMSNSAADVWNGRMLDGSGNGSLDKDISVLHETSGNKGNNFQDSALNSSLEKTSLQL